MIVLNSELPLTLDVLQRSMHFISWCDRLNVLVLVNESDSNQPTSAETTNALVQSIEAALETAKVAGSVTVQLYVPAKTPEQVILQRCEADRVDFLVLDRNDGWHPDCLKNGRATTLLLPASPGPLSV